MVLPVEPEFEQVRCFLAQRRVSYLPFFQALEELTTSLGPFLDSNPSYKKALEVVQVPERILQFRVVWEDDNGVARVNRGFRVQVCITPSSLLLLLTRFAVQLCAWPLQRRSPTSPLRQLVHPQVPWIRADLQERPHWLEHGRRKGWLRL